MISRKVDQGKYDIIFVSKNRGMTLSRVGSRLNISTDSFDLQVPCLKLHIMIAANTAKRLHCNCTNKSMVDISRATFNTQRLDRF